MSAPPRQAKPRQTVKEKLRVIQSAVEKIDRQQRDIKVIQERVKFRQENPPVTPKMRSPGRRAKDWGAPGSAFSTDSLDGSPKRPPPGTCNLVFTVESCRGLQPLLSTTSAFCKVRSDVEMRLCYHCNVINTSSSQVEFGGNGRRTKVADAGCDPMFKRESFVFKASSKSRERQHVEIEVWSRNVFVSDDFLGRARCDVGDDEGSRELTLLPKHEVGAKPDLGAVKVRWRRDFWAQLGGDEAPSGDEEGKAD